MAFAVSPGTSDPAEEREKALTVEGQEGRWRVVELVTGRTGEDYRRAAAEPEIPF